MCYVNANEPFGADPSQRRGNHLPAVQILGGGAGYPPNYNGGSGYPPNYNGQPGYRPIGTGHLPIENNGQWHSNYQRPYDSYGNHEYHGGSHGHHGHHRHHGSHGHRGNHGNHGNYGYQ